MKNWMTAGLALFLLSGIAYGADQGSSGAVSPPAGQKQMETDKEVANRSEQATPLDQQGGKLTGEVVGLNSDEGTLEIKTVNGGISRIKVDDKIKGQLKNIKKGDHIEAKINIEATELTRKPAG